MSQLEETIVAIASPAGGAARGIVRISGPGVLACLAAVFRSDGHKKPNDVTRPTALTGELRLDTLASTLPCELYLWPGRRSYTGEPVAELHTLGSPPLLDLLVNQLCTGGGARLAQPGEFTLRAFLSRRIDLTQAEAVLGVIDAHDQHRLDVALQQLAGGLAQPLRALRDSLLDLLSHLEAGFDFADEDLPFISPEKLQRQLADAAEITERLARRIHGRGTSGETPRASLSGWPNTGKSSLFNALAAFAESEKPENGIPSKAAPPKAIVSRHAGTTRDYLTARLDIDGVSCCLVDTAGIYATGGIGATDVDQECTDTTETVCGIVRESQQIAQHQAKKAQVRILCIDSTRPPNAWEESQIAAYSAEKETEGRRQQHMIVRTKSDAAEDGPPAGVLPSEAISTSSITGEGIAELRRRLRDAILAAEASRSAVVAPTAVRCRQSVRMAAESLARAQEIVQDRIVQNRDVVGIMPGEELVAAELRFALDELGKVVGTVYTDDVLDRVFSRFCIGK